MDKLTGITREEVKAICNKNGVKADTVISVNSIIDSIYECIEKNNELILKQISKDKRAE